MAQQIGQRRKIVSERKTRRKPMGLGQFTQEAIMRQWDKAKLWWNENRQLFSGRLLIIPFGVLVFLAILLAIREGYFYEKLGFSEYVSPTGEFHREKTFWDWMELLIVPFVLAGGAILFSRAEHRSEQLIAERQARIQQEIEADQLCGAILQSYLDKMSSLLLDKKLGTKESDSSVRQIARAQTLIALRELNREVEGMRGEDGRHGGERIGARKGALLKFLYEADLAKSEAIIDLVDADLEGAKLDDLTLTKINLRKANLRKAQLQGSNLVGANLSESYLYRANLKKTNLENASLYRADLRETDLRFAKLCNADLREVNLSEASLAGVDLTGANLEGANLEYTDLKGAKVTSKQLAVVKSLESAIMPSGLKYTGSDVFQVQNTKR